MQEKIKNNLDNFKKNFRFDLIAGITVALVMIPQSMAYAQIANLPMQAWLYTAFIWVIVWALFGSSKQMSNWPVTIISIMTAASLGSIWTSSTEEYMLYASMLAILIWITYLLLAFLRLWVIVEFLSHPVIIGFTNAIALITILSQLEKVFWINAKDWSHYLETIYILFQTIIKDAHIYSSLFWIWGIIFLFFSKKFFPKLPSVLVLIVISTFISYLINFEINFSWKVVWNIPEWLPKLINFFEIKDILSFKTIISLLPFAFIIAIIWFTESISVAKIVSIKTKQKLNSNREFIWQAMANISSWLFWGYWVAGSFSRTAVNLRAEAKTSLSSIITWIIIWLTLIFLTKLLYFIPMATLAAIIIVSVWSLIKIEPIIKAFKIQKNDAFIAILTFILTIAFSPSVEKAIWIWVFLSVAFYIHNSMRPKIVELCMYKTGILRDADFFKLKKSKNVSVFRVDWNLFFANIWFFEKTILNFVSEKKELKIVVFDFEWMANIDSSAFEALEDLINKLQNLWIRVILCWLRVKVIYKMSKASFIKKFWKSNIFEKTTDVIKYLENKYEKEELNIKSLLTYNPIDKKESKKSAKILEKIRGVG